MSNAKLEVGQLVVTSSTPPGNLGLYAHDQDTIGVVGDLVCVNPITRAASGIVTSSTAAGLIIVVSASAPDDGDGRPDGTVWIQQA
ncbi:MAG: hypothetical protein V5B38_04865 [Candidatus Accumulibacter propinquus]|jgi:hypothetical protein